eukprot:121294-Chlamydomonas_euryale.AAC.5
MADEGALKAVAEAEAAVNSQGEIVRTLKEAVKAGSGDKESIFRIAHDTAHVFHPAWRIDALPSSIDASLMLLVSRMCGRAMTHLTAANAHADALHACMRAIVGGCGCGGGAAQGAQGHSCGEATGVTGAMRRAACLRPDAQ